MKNRQRRTRILILPLVLAAGALVWALGGPAALADSDTDSDHDHDRARRILAKKEILPLDQVLAKVRAEVPGDVIDVELEEDDDIWAYELKIIEPSGKVVKINADAKTGVILKTKRK